MVTFSGRLIRRRETGATIDDGVIEECLYTPAADYQRHHGVRRTWLDGRRVDLAELYAQSDRRVPYATFRQRGKRLEREGLLDAASLSQANELTRQEWISFFGGGRRQTIVYDGEDFPEHAGRSFRSIAAFLRTINRYDARGNVTDRLKAGWPIDAALSEPILPATERTGTIYRIIQVSTGLAYVGLTISTLRLRWERHLTAVERGARTLLAQAIRADGKDGFRIEPLEDGLTWDELSAREKHWIATLVTLSPGGLNASRGGQVGGGRRKPTEIDGERFASVTEAAQVIGERLNLPAFAVETRWRSGQPLPERVRAHSKHPEAGSNLWRRWKSLLNAVEKGVRKGPIDPTWLDSYDAFAGDVRASYAPDLELVRIDEDGPWGPGNVDWVSRRKRVAQSRGKSATWRGRTYESLAQLASDAGIGLSTLSTGWTRECPPMRRSPPPCRPPRLKGASRSISKASHIQV